MAELSFKIRANWEEVQKLRNEISQLESQLKRVDMRRSPSVAEGLTKDIDAAKQRMTKLAEESVSATNKAMSTTKSSLDSAKNAVFSITEKIISQKSVVKEAQNEVNRLGEIYRSALKNKASGANGLLSEWTSAKKALNEEKSALFGLNQEKAKAQLEASKLKYQLDGLSGSARQGGVSFEQMGGSLAGLVGVLGGAAALKEVGNAIINVRSEFQQLEVAFTTMLRSKGKAEQLMGQLTKTAATTPFGLQEVAGGAKQLLAYGKTADEVNNILIHLGDIAAGMSLPLNDLIYLYGTTIVQGKMMTQDLKQFQGRGIPIAEALAKEFGVTKDKVAGLVTAGKVTADKFNKAIMSMADAGGQFGGLMEAQSRTIGGQISNIEDGIDMMFNNIGKSSEGLINSGLAGVSWLVEHYELLGKTLLTVAGTYGAYKAALMAVSAMESFQSKQLAQIEMQRQASLSSIIANYNAESTAQQANVASISASTTARNGEVTAIDLSIAALQREIQIKLFGAKVDFQSAQQQVASAEARVASADALFASRQAEYMAAVRNGNMTAVEIARTNLQTASEERNAAAKQLSVAQSNLATASANRELIAKKASTLQTEIDTVQKAANTKATGLWAAATNLATSAMERLKLAWASNPLGLAIMAITTVIGLLWSFTSSSEEASTAQQKYEDAISDGIGKMEGYKAILSVAKQGTDAYRNAISGLNELCKEHNVAMLDENKSIDEQADKMANLTRAIQAQSAQKILQAEAEEAVKRIMEEEKGASDDLKDSLLSTAIGYANFKIAPSETTMSGITQMVMSYSTQMKDAYKESEEAGVVAEAVVVENIKKMLIASGEAKEAVDSHTSAIREYVHSVAEASSDAYESLDKSSAQLNGIANQTYTATSSMQENLNGLSFEELVSKEKEVKDELVKVQNEIDNANSKELSPKVDLTNLHVLEKKLKDINLLMGKTIGTASNDALEERMKEARTRRDSSAYGSKEWKEADKVVEQIRREQDRRKKSTAEYRIQEENKKTKANTKGSTKKYDPKQAAYEIQKSDDTLKKKWKEIIDGWQEEIDKEQISKMEEGHSKILSQIAREKKEKLEALEDEIKAQVEAMKKHDFDVWKKRNSQKKDYDYKSSKTDEDYRKEFLSGEREIAYKARKASIESIYDKKRDDEEKKEKERQASSLLSFKLNYGSYLQKRSAIEEEEREKISKAETEGEKMSAKAEAKKKIAELDFKELQSQMDWEGVFSDLGVQATAQLEAMEQRLRSIIEANKDISPENMKTLVDALSNIRQEVANRNPFKAVTNGLKEMQAHAKSVDMLQRSLEVYSTSIGAVYRVAQENGDALVMATEGNKEVTVEYINEEGKAVTATMKYADALKMLKKEQKDLTKSQRTLNSGIKGIGSKLGEVAQIGSAFEDLAQSVGIDIPEGLSKAFDGIGKAGEAMEAFDVTKPGSFLNIKNYVNFASGLVGTFKGIGELLFGGADTKRYDEMKEKYDALIKVWDTLIDRKMEYLDKAEGKEITRTAQEAKSLVEEQMKSYRRLGKEYLNSGAGLFSHSKGVKLRKKMNAEDWAQVQKVLGHTNLGGRLDGLFSLSVEKLKSLQEGATSFWAKLDGQTQEYLNNIIEGEKNLQDIIDKKKESITGVSFDTFYDSFLSTLSEMDSAVSDFADDIENYLQKAILSSWVGQTLKKRLEKLYTQFSLSGEDGTITKEEASNLSAEYARIAKEAVDYRNSLKETFGWSVKDNDSSSKGGFSTMSQDTADQLNGRFTALHITTSEILNTLRAEDGRKTLLNLRAEDIKNIGVKQLDIVTQVLEMEAKNNIELQEINHNTRRSATSLVTISEDISEMKQKIRNL